MPTYRTNARAGARLLVLDIKKKNTKKIAKYKSETNFLFLDPGKGILNTVREVKHSFLSFCNSLLWKSSAFHHCYSSLWEMIAEHRNIIWIIKVLL